VPGFSPFDRNHANPWAENVLDLERLNGNVTDKIIRTIDAVRMQARQEAADLRTRSLLVLGPAGAGKTHLFARLRRKVGPRAVFVHLRPLVGTEMTPRYVLGQIVLQLGYDSNGGRQLDALVGACMGHLHGESPDFPSVHVADLRSLDDDARRQRLDDALEKMLARHPEADEMYLSRLLDAPFMNGPTQRAAFAWLSGREPEPAQLERLRATSGIAEENVIQAMQTLGAVAAPGAPIVLVFDQLENLMDAETTGSRVRAYANLVAELFDTMNGFVIVQMALDTEWQRAIAPELSEAQKTRLRGEEVLMSLPTADERRDLLKLWVSALPERPEPFPWPFTEARVASFCDELGMTPRMLMLACKRALEEGAQPDAQEEKAPATPAAASEDTIADALAESWSEHLSAARGQLDEAAIDRRACDPARLTGGVAGMVRFLDGLSVVRADAQKPVQVHLRGAGGECFVSLLHQSHPRSVVAALDKVAERARTGRVIVLRERVQEFPPTWKKAHAARAALVKQRVTFVDLERDDTARLLAMESFLASARSRDLEDGEGRALGEDEVVAWMGKHLQVLTWSPVAMLLGQAPAVDDSEVDAAAPVADTSAAGPPGAAASEAKAQARPTAATSGVAASSAGETEPIIRTVLSNLRIASLDRLVREVARVRREVTRAEVVAALAGMESAVRWFGRSILAFQERAAEKKNSSPPERGRSKR
jgi:hypothetical protein